MNPAFNDYLAALEPFRDAVLGANTTIDQERARLTLQVEHLEHQLDNEIDAVRSTITELHVHYRAAADRLIRHAPSLRAQQRAQQQGAQSALDSPTLLLPDVVTPTPPPAPTDLNAAKTSQIQAAGVLDIQLGYYLDATDPLAARRWYEKRASAGDTDAMARLAAILEKTAQTGDELSAACHWYREAATAGHAEAAYRLGRFIETRWSVEEDSVRIAGDWYRRAAEAGHTDAMYHLGVVLEGLDSPADLDDAHHWYARAAEAGQVEAMCRLAALLETRFESKDLLAARRWYKRASEAGYTEAMYQLARMLTDDDPGQASHWWEKAARAGHGGAMYRLAQLLETGSDSSNNDALNWYLAAAEAGNGDAMFRLAELHQPDPAKQRYWYERAALVGNDEARCRFGVLLASEGLSSTAQTFLHTAALNGHTDAMYHLARLLETTDPTTARHWYETAANTGHTDAMYQLGLVHWSQDRAAATGWFERAASAGNTDAMYRLGLALEDPTEQLENSAAGRWYQRAAESGHSGAMARLGYLFESAAPPDAATATHYLREAHRWYRQAAQAGNNNAEHRAGVLTATLWDPGTPVSRRGGAGSWDRTLTHHELPGTVIVFETQR